MMYEPNLELLQAILTNFKAMVRIWTPTSPTVDCNGDLGGNLTNLLLELCFEGLLDLS